MPAERTWSLVLLTPEESGRRNRRTVDGVILAVVAILAGLTAVVASSAPETDEDVADALITVLGWAEGLWRTIVVTALITALVVVVDVLVRRRWALARDLLLALVIVLGLGSDLGGVVDSDWLPIEDHLLSQWAYPELRIACARGGAHGGRPRARSSPPRVRGLARLPCGARCGRPGAALPSGRWAPRPRDRRRAIVRLAFGTAGRRSARGASAECARLPWRLDSRPRALAAPACGAAQYVGHDPEGRGVKVRVLGRDAQDTQRLARRWRALAYRDPPRSVADGRLEQVEHEALAT